ncbi:G5 domain-containing protein [Actinoplanes sp. NPDC023714]|uniref:G5 domain-containing protein n=1 Tax=Actinoplanes sp. NPDC023714 TaxID=3154322 RepID=UPI0033D0926A
MPRKSWWARLPFGVRMTAGTTALLVLVGGGVAGVTTLARDDASTVASAADPAAEPDPGLARLEESPEVVSRAAAAAEPLPKRHTPAPPRPPATAADQLGRARVDDERADRTGPRPSRAAGEATAERTAPHRAATPGGSAKDRAPATQAQPVVTTRTDVETREIPYDTQVIRDPSLPRGTRKIESPGASGEETLRYLVTLTNGKQTARILIGSEVTRAPEPRIVVFGARRKWDRDCEGALRVCVPLGRSAVCPEAEAPAGAGQGDPDRPGAEPVREEGLRAILTVEELALLDPIDRVRLEPASVCR